MIIHKIQEMIKNQNGNVEVFFSFDSFTKPNSKLSKVFIGEFSSTGILIEDSEKTMTVDKMMKLDPNQEIEIGLLQKS